MSYPSFPCCDSGVPSLLLRSVTALGLDLRNGGVPLDQSLAELRQLAISVVRDGPNLLSGTLLDLGSRVKLAHRDYLDTPDLVVIGDGLGT